MNNLVNIALSSSKGELVFPKIGEIFEGYKIIKKLGSGGSSIVFKAEPTSADLPSTVALKVSAKGSEYIAQEALTLSLNLPAFPTLYEYKLDNPLSFIALERINGLDLVSIVKRYGKLDEVTALKMLLLTTKALNSIYEQKRVTHNDLSPVNIFIDKYFRAKLIDPCSSTINGERLPNTVCMYTRAICAPELHHEKPTGTIFHDVFALGPTLYFLVTETFMFPNKSGSKSYEQKMSQSEENLPGVSEDLSRLIRRLTNPNPFLRYDNYPELINDIKELILSKLYPE